MDENGSDDAVPAGSGTAGDDARDTTPATPPPAQAPAHRPVSSHPVPRPGAAAFFDLDKTIIATSSATAFSRPFLAGGLLTRRAVVRTAIAQFLYLVGGADAAQTERLRANLAQTVTGWDVAQVSSIVEDTLHESIDAAVYAEAVALIEEHHAAGRDVVVVSASGGEVVRPIAAVLGADHVIATRMSVVDGRYTGAIDFYAYGENKALAITELAAERGYDLAASYAYSDSITDAPMLEVVGHGFAVNPDRALRRLAAESGWGVLTFSRPVALRALMTPPRTVVAGLAAAAAVAVGVLVWHLVRRARRGS
ncbi:HAD family phosphatase [Cellulomonas cellasea]|uniref:HAD superfamily hydrolase (TIGR01490 family) n=1 Tax=Cellulomonas cellasea TaxID=43670 RepID=A0A7W4YA89_9CELL|nr:HAD family hydrolase [Cellulomonas cellasea]MBB2922373.1 HAD superfamily hydrolase (TIGR01490 family) [Cellulomonas cellasea]